jgi:hypothetical protein
MPQLSSSIPPTSTIDGINRSPHSNPTFQCFCHIKTCPYHYGGDDLFSNDKTSLLHAELHGNNIHQSLLLSLPSDILTSIGWSWCCGVCPTLFLSADSLHHHQSTCSNFTTTCSTPTSQLNRSTRDKLYFLCPPSWHSKLDSLLISSPDANPQTLFAQVTTCFLESKCPTISPASPHTTK